MVSFVGAASLAAFTGWTEPQPGSRHASRVFTLPAMPTELEPAELARLIDFAERPRVQDWSLRAALVRYAQGQPRRVSEVIELVRRLEFAIRPHLKSLGRDGPAVWAALQSGDR